MPGIGEVSLTAFFLGKIRIISYAVLTCSLVVYVAVVWLKCDPNARETSVDRL